MKKYPHITSLAKFASLEPPFEELEKMANEIAHAYVHMASH